MPVRHALAAGLFALALIGSAQAESLSDELRTILETFRDRYAFPGATAAIALPDGQIAGAATGAADVEAGRPMAPDMPMLAASVAPEMVTDLPRPARRDFTCVIAPATPLLLVAEIDMTGRCNPETQDDPRYQPKVARQILAAPEGFVGAMRTRAGMSVSGSDSGQWTPFRIFGLIPVARQGGTADDTYSAFGRHIGEAVIWSPAALLPCPGVYWEALNEDTARVTVRYCDQSQMVAFTVDTEGQPVTAVFQSRSNPNPDEMHGLQPFGAVMSGFRDVGDYRLLFRVEAGNNYGTDAHFPFFIADVQDIRFTGAEL